MRLDARPTALARFEARTVSFYVGSAVAMMRCCASAAVDVAAIARKDTATIAVNRNVLFLVMSKFLLGANCSSPLTILTCNPEGTLTCVKSLQTVQRCPLWDAYRIQRPPT